MRIPWFGRTSKLYVSLDIGSCFLRMAAEQVFSDGKRTVLGRAECPSVGMRHGEVFDAKMVRQCIEDVCQLCERTANIDIATVYLGVTGAHFIGENNRASYRLPEEEYLINAQHITMAREKARGFTVSDDRFVVNDWCGRFFIDKRETTRFPIGLAGRTLELNCHIMSGLTDALQRTLLCLRQVPLQVDDIVFAPLAAAHYLLSPQEREDGAVLINIGGGTTDYICYDKGDVVASGCLPLGGIHINQELMQCKLANSGTKPSYEAVEWLKCHHGDASGDMNDRTLVSFSSDIGLHSLHMEQGLLNHVICRTLTDILGRVKTRLSYQGLLRGGMRIYLTGGCSLMRGIDSLAADIFGLPVVYPQSKSHLGKEDREEVAKFSTAIGLNRYARWQEIQAQRES